MLETERTAINPNNLIIFMSFPFFAHYVVFAVWGLKAFFLYIKTERLKKLKNRLFSTFRFSCCNKIGIGAGLNRGILQSVGAFRHA